MTTDRAEDADPALVAAVVEVEQFVQAAGWDRSPELFALVRTRSLVQAQPSLAAQLDDGGELTAIAQEPLVDSVGVGDSGEALSDALARVAWPDQVDGCVLAQEILVLPQGLAQLSGAGGPDPDPDAAAAVPGAPAAPNPAAWPEPAIPGDPADHSDGRHEARLVVGVLRGHPVGVCLIRIRDLDVPVVGGPHLAPNVLAALRATFDD